MTPERRDKITEVAAAVLIALAAVSTAWAGYQASEWHGEQSLAQGTSNRLRLESTRASNEANRQAQIDVALFTQWVDAYALGRTELAAFYRHRFREEFQPAFRRWIASRPLDNPRAALSPFALPEYRLQKLADADALDDRAAAAHEEVKADLDHANNYVLAVVLFATSLALAGIGSRLPLAAARTALVALAWVVYLGTVAWLATFPVSL